LSTKLLFAKIELTVLKSISALLTLLNTKARRLTLSNPSLKFTNENQVYCRCRTVTSLSPCLACKFQNRMAMHGSLAYYSKTVSNTMGFITVVLSETPNE
jgi:hypothetical protein